MGALGLGERTIAPECPSCGRQVFLTLSPGQPQPDGTLMFDGTVGRWGLLIHLRVACEGRDR
jgi:hypothetical protein